MKKIKEFSEMFPVWTSVIWAFIISWILGIVYYAPYTYYDGNDGNLSQILADKTANSFFPTVDAYSFLLSMFFSIGIAIYLYIDNQKEIKEQKQNIEIIKDGTRNHINDFPEIFAKSLKMIYNIKKENNYENFIYVNFFLSFGAVHAIFDENQKVYQKIALNLGLDKIKIDDKLDLTNLEDAIIFFNKTLWEILENDNKSIFLLAGDSNLDLTESVEYYNKTYEISKIIIKIIVEKNDKHQAEDNNLTFYQNAVKSRFPITTEDKKIDILSRIEKKHLYYTRNLPFIIRVVSYELGKQKLTIEHLSNIFKLFDLQSITRQDTQRLRILISKDIKSEEDEKEIEKLKSEKFCILEAIYFLLKDVTDKEGLKEQIKRLSLYIQYSKKINELLEKEFYQRKKLRDKIKDKTIDVSNSKNEIYFLKKEHFPHQGLIGTFRKNDDIKKATLIFFISGDTTGSKPKGYYSELDNMYKLHFGAFKDIIASNFKKKE